MLGRTLVLGDDGGVVYGFDAQDGGETWRVRLDGGLVGAPALASGMLYAATVSGGVYALN